MKLPLILINFKCYQEALGEKALKLAKYCEKISENYEVTIGVAPQFTDIYQIASKVKIPVFSQHVDALEYGAYTGHVSPLAIKEAGAKGSLVNHSERKLSLEEIKECVEILRKYKLISVVCADSIVKGKEIAKFNPDFIAYEDPFLIGSGRAISRVKPDSVRKFVKTIYNINQKVKVLCGAGITSGEDVKKALELGTEGVLVASGVVKAKDPKKVLKEFAEAIL
jgi:triosephosphate isomerase